MTRKEIRIIAVDRVPAEVGEWLNLGLPRTFELPCRAGRTVRHPPDAWNAQRRQYLADTVLNRMDRESSLCVTAFSNSLADTDLKSQEFCSRCRRLLRR